MSEDENKLDQPLNMNELRNRLQMLGVYVPKRTLWNWAEKELILSPERRGKTARSWSRQRKNCVGLARERSYGTRLAFGRCVPVPERIGARREISSETVKEVQKFAAKVYNYPNVVLSIPHNTRDNYDPPLEDVGLSVLVDCPPKLKRFIIPHVTAILKAFWGWWLKEPALITFRWGNSVSKSESGAFERPLEEVSLGEAPHAR